MRRLVMLAALLLAACSDATGPAFPFGGYWNLNFQASSPTHSCSGSALSLNLWDSTAGGLGGTVDGIACSDLYWFDLFVTESGDSVTLLSEGLPLLRASGIRAGDHAGGTLKIVAYGDTLQGTWSATHDQATDALHAAMAGSWHATSWVPPGSQLNVITHGFHYNLIIAAHTLQRGRGDSLQSPITETNVYYGLQAPRFWTGDQLGTDQFTVNMPNANTLILTGVATSGNMDGVVTLQKGP